MIRQIVCALGAMLLAGLTYGEERSRPFVVRDGWAYQYSTDGGATESMSEYVRAVDGDTAEVIVSLPNAKFIVWRIDHVRQRYLGMYIPNSKGEPGTLLEDKSTEDATIVFPFDVGSTWTVNRAFKAGGEKMTHRLSAKVVQREKIKTPAGEFDAYKIELDGFWAASDYAQGGVRGRHVERYWYVPAVKRFVRREISTYGWGTAKTTSVKIFDRTDELIAFRLADGLSGGDLRQLDFRRRASTGDGTTPRNFVVGSVRFEGDFNRDPDGTTYSGRGVLTWPNGDVYTGDVRRGIRTGQGVFVWPDGQRYEGLWSDNKPHGLGSMKFANGNAYRGTMDAGVPTGEGEMTYASGDRYTGSFDNGKPNGTGTYSWKDGSRYTGQWKAGKKDGRGVLTWADGKSWEGDFADDERKGQ